MGLLYDYHELLNLGFVKGTTGYFYYSSVLTSSVSLSTVSSINNWHWLSTSYTLSSGFAWVIHSYDGRTNGGNKTTKIYVWAVRGGN